MASRWLKVSLFLGKQNAASQQVAPREGGSQILPETQEEEETAKELAEAAYAIWMAWPQAASKPSSRWSSPANDRRFAARMVVQPDSR